MNKTEAIPKLLLQMKLKFGKYLQTRENVNANKYKVWCLRIIRYCIQ